MSSRFDQEYKKLNKQQREAVDSIDGPLLVIAGPGTGKTQLLSLRTANILRLTDIEPANILCLTFTDAAALNMRERLLSIIGPKAHKVGIYTFHGFGASIIQNLPEYFYDQPLLNPTDQLTEYEILEQILSKLPYSNPLSQRFGDDFLHLPTVASNVSWLKQAGISVNELKKIATSNDSFFKLANESAEKAFTQPTSYAQRPAYELLYKKLDNLAEENPLAKLAADELKAAIEELSPNTRYAKSITAWRNNWLKQIRPGKWQFSDFSRNKFVKALTEVYEQYQDQLLKSGLYTFDDMIIRTNQAIESNDELRLSLQEQYLYILVDEYQDTNGAQNKLLDLLATHPVNEDKPNLMVVGDDDQAIYRFQGANSSIMSEFLIHWPKTKVVVLEQSYRSGQALLDAASAVIANASGRIVDQADNLEKKLTGSSGYSTDLFNITLENEASQYAWLGEQVRHLIDSGVAPSTIAILAPKHVYLRRALPYLISAGINVSYERREQVLEQPRIIELIDLIELTLSIASHNKVKINSLLPKVLAADYWGLSGELWWEVASAIRQNHEDWLGHLSRSKNEFLADLIKALMVVAKQSQNQPFAFSLAQLMGNSGVDLGNRTWLSTWQNYYFNEQVVEQRPAESLSLIGQLDSLIQAFNKWRGEKFSSLADFGRFISLYKRSGLSLLDPSLEINREDSITLTTVYKAKGLEWDNVFLINCLDDIWGPQTRSRNLTFRLTTNLQWIQPARQNSNDLIRLFYVALTRARHSLYLSDYRVKDNSKIAEPLRWLDAIDSKRLTTEPSLKAKTNGLSEIKSLTWFNQLVLPEVDLKTLTEPIIKTYKLSATHLNNFLSIERGGPKYFLLHNLFRIPDSPSNSAMYGDAIHQTLDYIQHQFSTTGKIPSVTSVRQYFTEKIDVQPMPIDQLELFKNRGLDELIGWLKSNSHDLKPTDLSERNFNSEAVNIDSAKLTGKIDRLVLSKDQAIVIDYKTSRPLGKWTGSNPQQAIQGYSYLRQLYFYKLLVENSNTFSKKYRVREGRINFISPDQANQYAQLTIQFDEAETKRQKQLIKRVWQHIVDLSIPDISNYPSTLAGIKAFEEDLINEKV